MIFIFLSFHFILNSNQFRIPIKVPMSTLSCLATDYVTRKLSRTVYRYLTDSAIDINIGMQITRNNVSAKLLIEQLLTQVEL